MKNNVLAVLFLCVTHVAGAAEEQCSEAKLQGSWSLESAMYTDANGNVIGEIKDGQTLSRKLLIQGDVNFITWQPDGEVKVAAAGNYVIKDGRYVETISVSTYKGILNKVFDFNCNLVEGKWLHSGQENDIQISEIWVKKAEK